MIKNLQILQVLWKHSSGEIKCQVVTTNPFILSFCNVASAAAVIFDCLKENSSSLIRLNSSNIRSEIWQLSLRMKSFVYQPLHWFIIAFALLLLIAVCVRVSKYSFSFFWTFNTENCSNWITMQSNKFSAQKDSHFSFHEEICHSTTIVYYRYSDYSVIVIVWVWWAMTWYY